ncbi:helix-turn-helix domain-containing protein [Streptomyces sp. M19]
MEPDARRAEILAVARRRFGAHSYASVSTSDIAAEAGVARGLINHYFGGKRQLYLEVVRQMMVIPASVSERLPPTTPRSAWRSASTGGSKSSSATATCGCPPSASKPSAAIRRSTRSCWRPTRSPPTGSSKPP